jgi:hypothetical protein
MSTTATAGSSTTHYKPAPAGNQLAICIGVIDLGTQRKVFNGEVSFKPTILLQWELVDERRDDGNLFTLSREFTLSLHENSNLRPFLNAWRGRPFTEEEARGFDVKNLLGVPCMLNVVHEKGKTDQTKTYANVSSVAPLPKRVTAPEPSNDLIYYNTDDGPPPESLPKWIREKILKAQQFQGEVGATAQASPPSDLASMPGPDPVEEWDENDPRF